MTATDPRPTVGPPPGDRASRVLYLTHRVPFPPDKGDRIRNFHLLRQLAGRGKVWLGCLADEPVTPETTAALCKLCEQVAVVPVCGKARWVRAGWSVCRGGSLSEGAFAEPELRRLLRVWAAETTFDAAVVSASSLVPYLREPELRATPAFVDLVDVDSQKWLDFAAASRGPKRWLYRLEAARLRKLESALPGWVRAVSVVSRTEADLYDAFAGVGAATVVPNGVDLDYFHPTHGLTEPACAFVGAMDYLPNIDAAVWFAHEVWPRVRERFPDAEFRIIGRKPAPAVRELAMRPGVNLIGQVPDVRPFLASAAVAVVPLRLARGIQNKVLEALAMAKPVVAAPAALAGLRAEPGVHLLAASTSDEWVAAITRLFTDPNLGRNLGAAGRRFVDDHHHWERCLDPLVSRIVEPQPTPV